jgi:tRNA modification GTPase
MLVGVSDVPDTIFALSSGRPPAAIAVVRMSGPRSGVALEALLGRLPVPRQASLARVRDPATGELIDEALALWFPAPRSETGEDVAELQLHGGHAVVAAVLAALGKLAGLRLAEPGEFTRRAFENGQLDLTQVEGLGDLIAAQTQAQRRQAFGQLRGLLGDRAESWRKQVIEASALVAAGIDFSDEGDVPNNLTTQAMAIVHPLAAEIAQALAGADRGERLRDGLWVVIAGPPNAGKSTLLNRIARREAAIVSPIAGTTRDVIEVHLDLDGYPVNLVDTAGVRAASDDPIEREGMRRARAAAARADLVLWLVDASARDAADVAAVTQEPLAPGTARWIVYNKIDLIDPETAQKLAAARPQTQGTQQGADQDTHQDTHCLSATTGAGFEPLLAALARFAAQFFTPEPALVTRRRQHATLTEVLHALAGADTLAAQGAGEELVAEQLRHAATALGKLTGRIDVEDILDVIFREFCVGK